MKYLRLIPTTYTPLSIIQNDFEFSIVRSDPVWTFDRTSNVKNEDSQFTLIALVYEK